MMRVLKFAMLTATLTVFALLATVSAAPSDRAIIEKMMAMYNLDPASYEIEIISNPLQTAEVSSDNVILIPLTQKEPSGLYTVIAKVTENGEVVESGQVRMKIMRFADVVVLTDKISSREPLTENKLSLKRMEITSLYEKPLQSIAGVEKYRAKRNLAPGTILTTVAVEPIPDVEPGKEVTIIYDDGLCRISAAGVALQSGLAGEYVKVKNKASNKIIVARVVDETAVAVDP
jgi:flagella basal body P-ring formation protein FlgA